MKLALYASVIFFSFTAMAVSLKPETKVRHPVALQGSKKVPTVAAINKLLPKGDAVPEYFEVKESENAEAAFERWSALTDKFDKNMKQLGKHYNLTLGLIPTSIDSATKKTCYVGLPSQVASVVQTLIGYEFTEQLTIWGIRHGQVKAFELDEESLQDMLSEAKPAWTNYDVKSDTVVLLGSHTDSGDDTNTIVIERCK